MSDTSHAVMGKILAFAAIVEAVTGFALIVVPAIVIALLQGVSTSGGAISLGRFLGVALFALGLACWPSRQLAVRGSSAFWGMLTYNVLVALYLACLGTIGHWWGILLWPSVALHSIVALLLVWTCRAERQTKR
jgi:hypothetical protein